MAANDVQIQIIGKDLASAAFKQVDSAAQATARNVQSFGVSINSVNSILGNAAGFAIGIAGFQGLTAAIQGTAGAIFNFQRSMEINETGIAGILMSMTEINGRSLTWEESLGVSKTVMSQLNSEAMRTAATTEELTNAFRGILGPALSAGMTIDQIIKLTSTGVNAVKSIMPGNAEMQRQIVQELRDLVAGGIQPASSTLATALGLKDSDIEKAKKSSQGLFNFLMDRLKGFETAAPYYAKTWQGIWDQIKEGVTLGGSKGTAGMFESAKEEMNEIASKVVTFNEETNKMEVNPAIVAGFKEVSDNLMAAGRGLKEFGSEISVVAVPAAKLLGGTLKFAANHATGLAYIATTIYGISKASEAAAAAQRFWNAAVAQTEAKYVEQVTAAHQAAAAQRAASTAAMQQQIQSTLAGTTTATAAVAATMGQTQVAKAIILAENEKTIAVERTAEVMNAANIAVKAGQMEIAQAIIATNLTIEQQAAAAGIMGERMVLACEVARAGQLGLAQSILATNITLAEAGTVATASGVKTATGAAGAMTAQNALTGSVVATTGAQVGAGIAAEGAAAKAVAGMGVASTAAGNFGKMLLALAGGWVGVAIATGFALKAAYDYYDGIHRINSYNKNTRLYAHDGKYFKQQWKDGGYTTGDMTSGGTYSEVEVSSAEYEAQYEWEDKQEAARKKAEALENGDFDSLMGESNQKMKDLLAESTNKYDSTDKDGKAKKKKHEKWEIADEAGGYADMIKQAADAYGVDRNLFAALVKAESSFDPNAESGAGAIGFSQLMPDTAEALGVNAYDPRENLMGGAHYLRQQLDAFGGNVRMALAAYNAGPGAVRKYGGVPPYEETQSYVNKIIGYLDASGNGSEDKAGDYYKQQEEARKKALELDKQLDSKLNSTKMLPKRETETQKLDSEVAVMKKQAADLAASGVDTSGINQKIEQYKKVSTDKIIKNWQDAWTDLKNQSTAGYAELTDNASAAADAEYAVTIKKLQDEKTAKEQTVMVDENDKEGKLAVEKWYNDQVLIAEKTRNQKQREDMMKLFSLQVEMNNNELSLGKKTAAEVDAANLKVYNSEIARMQDLLDHEKLTFTERAALEGQLSDAVQKRNGVLSHSFDTGAAVAIDELKKQTTDFKEIYMSTWSSMESSTKSHIENILTMNESLGDGIKGTILGISEAVVKMFADILYQTYIMQPLKDWFTGILGNVSGGKTTTDSGYGFAFSGLANSFFGGSSGSSSRSSSGYSIMDGGGFFDLPGLATGGLGSGWTIVGEEGPELVNFSNPGRVYNTRDTSAALSGAASTTRTGPSIVMNIKTNDASSFKQSRGQILGSMGAAVRMAERNM